MTDRVPLTTLDIAALIDGAWLGMLAGLETQRYDRDEVLQRHAESVRRCSQHIARDEGVNDDE